MSDKSTRPSPPPADDLVEKVARAIRDYFTTRTGFVNVRDDGTVSACYGGNWIDLSPDAIARAALRARAAEEGEGRPLPDPPLQEGAGQ